MWLIGFVGSKVGRLVAGALAVLASILLVFKAGQRDQKKQQQVDGLKDYKKNMEKIDEVDVNTDLDSATKRLSKNGGLRD
tara:strand:+ start:277 stop:516 length:240 start_codon:yes stop_codon:yes gene_type:complete